MNGEIFCQENFCNDKERECRMKVNLGESPNFNSDEPIHLNDNKLLKNKRVSIIFFISFPYIYHY